MADILIVLLLVLILAAAVMLAIVRRKTSSCCGSSGPSEKAVSAQNHAYSNRMVRRIDGMVCTNCAVRAQNALNAMTGVQAKVRYDRREAEIFYDDTVTERQIAEVLAKAGFVLQ